MRTILALSLALVVSASSAPAVAEQEKPKPFVYVLGAVKRPGQYPAQPGLTLSTALKLAGGSSLKSDLTRVRISRTDNGKITACVVDSRSKSIVLRQGDTVVVPERTVLGPDNVITRYFKDMPFADAVDSILKDTNYGYSIDSSLAGQNLKVTASLKNTPVESALNTLSRAVGASYQLENGTVVIGGPNALYYGASQRQAAGAAASMYAGSHPARGKVTFDASQAGVLAAPNRSETIDLDYVQAGDMLPIVSNVQGVQAVRSAGTQRIVVTAPQSAIDEAKNAIKSLDTEDALPKVVQVGLAAKVTVEGNDYSCATSTRGAEGTQIPLNLSASHIDLGRGNVGQIELEAMATPVVLRSPIEGKDVCITGSGVISGSLPAKFEQRFDFSVSLASGLADAGDSVKVARFRDEPVIASGSLKTDGTDIGFKVTANALVEGGRVINQTRAYSQNAFGALDPRGTEESIRKQNSDREQARVLVIKGSDMLEQGRLEEAGRHFQEALILDPDNAAAHNGLGKALLGQGKIEEATVELRKAVRLDPANLDYQQDLHKQAGIGTGAGGQDK